jgi:hypothetical protein
MRTRGASRIVEVMSCASGVGTPLACGPSDSSITCTAQRASL